MFSRQRVSRGPEQPTSSNAMAAASAIGKALNSNGLTVDRNRLPEHNRSSLGGSRPSSVVASRRNSILSNRSPASRNGSLTKAGSPSTSAIEDIRRRTSVGSYIGTKNGSGRTYSLQLSRGPSSRSSSFTSRGNSQSADPKATFQEFGGQQASGIIHRPQNNAPKTVKKYIPTSHGLVAVDVPIEEVELQKRKAHSLRRSSSTNSLSLSRNNSLVRRGAPQITPPNRRHSSLTSNSVSNSITSSRSRQTGPLMQTYVEEETEQELSQDVARPLLQEKEIEPSPRVTPLIKATLPDSKDEEETKGPSADAGQEPIELEKKDSPVALPDALKEVDQKLVEQETVEQKSVELETKEVVITQPNVSKEGGEIVSHSVEEVTKAETDAENSKITVKEAVQIVIQPAEAQELKKQVTGGKDDLSEDEMIDASDIFESGAPETPNKSTDTTGHSLAQHLRAVNPYLNQRDTDLANNKQETGLDESKNLFKVSTPMKSALKKTNTQSSASSSMYSEKSPANQAYLSLTTAENTRLNAQLASSESSIHRQNSKHLSRPPSIVKPRSASPSPREGAKNKRSSNVPKQVPVNRNSLVRPPSETTPAVAAARTSNLVNRSRQDSVKRKAQEQIKTAMRADNNGGTKQVSDSILYPKEPPQKRSSFEKTRNQDSTLGFKKLSLRDETATEPTPELGGVRQHASHDSNSNFLQNSGWKSRFHDSDSEEENVAFSTGTSRSTQPTSVGTNADAPEAGFSIFKSKNKPNSAPVNLAPPQPAFAEREAVSANSTPTKVNKKWSKLSLRSSSTSETPRTETATPPDKRFHSNSKLEGFSYDSMRSGEPRASEAADPAKKKNKLGKKLKKLFGRN